MRLISRKEGTRIQSSGQNSPRRPRALIVAQARDDSQTQREDAADRKPNQRQDVVLTGTRIKDPHSDQPEHEDEERGDGRADGGVAGTL